MNTVIHNTEDAVFKFTQKEVTDRLIGKKTEYDPDEVSQLLELISVAAHGLWVSRLTLSETHSSVSHFSIW